MWFLKLCKLHHVIMQFFFIKPFEICLHCNLLTYFTLNCLWTSAKRAQCVLFIRSSTGRHLSNFHGSPFCEFLPSPLPWQLCLNEMSLSFLNFWLRLTRLPEKNSSSLFFAPLPRLWQAPGTFPAIPIVSASVLSADLFLARPTEEQSRDVTNMGKSEPSSLGLKLNL